MSVAGVIARLTAEEYGKLPEVTGFRDELIEGERVLAAFPKTPHAVVIENLDDLLRKQFPDKHIVREQGWYFQIDGIDNVPGPDIAVFSPEDYERSIRLGGWFIGQPLFVIEVISPTERKARRLQKVGLYLEAGAGAVVEVDYTKRVVLAYRPADDVAELIRDRITWPFTADLPEIFARLATRKPS
jgi:Uma2 family endonuclease